MTFTRVGKNWNTEMDALAKALPGETNLTGTHTERLAVSTFQAGRLWRESDTGLVFRDTGSAWAVWKREGLIYKSELQTVNNSTETVKDNAFLFELGKNERWDYEIFLKIIGKSTTADFKGEWELPEGASHLSTFLNNVIGVGPGSEPPAMSSTTVIVGLGNKTCGVVVRGELLAGSKAGTAQWKFAQNTKTAEDVTVSEGSRMIIRLLTP